MTSPNSDFCRANNFDGKCSKQNVMYCLHGWSDSTVIERRQQQLGRMADFLPPVTFSVFDL